MLDLCRIFRCAWFRWYDSAAIPDWLWRRSRVIVSEGLCRSGHQRISMLRITLVHFGLWECQGLNLEKDTVRFQVGLLEGQPIPSWTSDGLWRRSSATVCEGCILPPTRSMPIRTSEKVKASRKSHTVLSCLTSAESFITPDFVGTIPLDSVRFRRGTSHGFHRRSSTRRRLPRKCITECFQSRSRMKNPEAAAASQQLARYWRCLVLVQATALEKPTARLCFWDKFAFLNWRGPGGAGSQDLCPQKMNRLMTGKRDRGESIGQSMRDRENLHKILERKAESSIQGGEWISEKLSEIEADVEIRRWEQRSSEIALHESYQRTWNSKITASSGDDRGQCSKRKN